MSAEGQQLVSEGFEAERRGLDWDWMPAIAESEQTSLITRGHGSRVCSESDRRGPCILNSHQGRRPTSVLLRVVLLLKGTWIPWNRLCNAHHSKGPVGRENPYMTAMISVNRIFIERRPRRRSLTTRSSSAPAETWARQWCASAYPWFHGYV